MRYLKRYHIPWICLAFVALAMYGCSFIYVIQLDGRIVSGVDQAPVAGAMITVGGSGKGSICTSDHQGRWRFKTRTTNPQFDRDDGEKVIAFPLQIEAHGNVFNVTTNIPIPDNGRSINCFVLTTLELDSAN